VSNFKAVTEKGQVTIPRQMLHDLDLNEGDMLTLTFEDGFVSVSRAGDLLEYLYGIGRDFTGTTPGSAAEDRRLIAEAHRAELQQKKHGSP
jgi:AbrB family looped-hinge helix DNA binding protein